MHISTDEITMNKVYDGGVPYIIKHNEGPMSTIGISLGNELNDKRKPCQADRSGKRAPVSQCKTQSDRCYLDEFFFLKRPRLRQTYPTRLRHRLRRDQEIPPLGNLGQLCLSDFRATWGASNRGASYRKRPDPATWELPLRKNAVWNIPSHSKLVI